MMLDDPSPCDSYGDLASQEGRDDHFASPAAGGEGGALGDLGRY